MPSSLRLLYLLPLHSNKSLLHLTKGYLPRRCGKKMLFFGSKLSNVSWKNWIEEQQQTKSKKEVCSSTRGVQNIWVHINQTTLHWRFLVKKTVRFHIDLPTSRAQIFSRARSASGRFFVFLRQKRARERKLGPTTETGNEKRRTLRKSRFHIA